MKTFGNKDKHVQGENMVLAVSQLESLTLLWHFPTMWTGQVP